MRGPEANEGPLTSDAERPVCPRSQFFQWQQSARDPTSCLYVWLVRAELRTRTQASEGRKNETQVGGCTWLGVTKLSALAMHVQKT